MFAPGTVPPIPGVKSLCHLLGLLLSGKTLELDVMTVNGGYRDEGWWTLGPTWAKPK